MACRWLPSSCVFFKKFIQLIYFFIFFCIGSLLLCTGFLQLRCFSLRWLLLLWSTGSRCTGFSICGSQVLERRLSSCGSWAQLLHSMWDLPGPGLEPVSPALAGKFLTTAPPGKPLLCLYRAFFLCAHGELYGVSSSSKGTSPIRLGPHPYNLINLNYLLKNPISKYSH